MLLKDNYLSLTSLELGDSKGLKCLTVGIILERLVLKSCEHLFSINLVEGLVGLKHLDIKNASHFFFPNFYPCNNEIRSLLRGLDKISMVILFFFTSFPLLTELELCGWKKGNSVLPTGKIN